MPDADTAFISCSQMTAPEHHRAYNEWHQLDHLPENLRLPGVAWGQRWVCSPACRDAALVGADPFSSFEYLTLYWFRPPSTESIGAWSDLADRSFQWGRRPDLDYTVRSYMGFFRPVLGYASPRIDVAPEALPMRPNRGAFVVISDVTDEPARRSAVERRNRWYDREGLPGLLAKEGVAGGWTFTADESLIPESWAAREQRQGAASDEPTTLRLTVLFLDGDPIDVARSIAVDEVLAPDGDGIETLRFAGPLETIQPWTWDWFDGVASPEATLADS